MKSHDFAKKLLSLPDNEILMSIDCDDITGRSYDKIYAESIIEVSSYLNRIYVHLETATCNYCNFIHFPDMKEGVFVSLDSTGINGSMWAEHDSSGAIIYALTYHDGGIKSKIVFSTFHPREYECNLETLGHFTVKELNKKHFFLQYTGDESINSVLKEIL